MITSAIEIITPKITDVFITEDTLKVELSDGRAISVPLVWYPRLLEATEEEAENWRLIGDGYGIHWEDIDEDISIMSLLSGKPSGESPESFKKWLNKRKANK